MFCLALIPIRERPMNYIRAPADEDGEWTLVITSDLDPNGQCGGTSETITGKTGTGQCLKLPGYTMCGSVKVNTGFLSCDFQFKPKSCDDNASSEVKVDKGGEKSNVKLEDVKFVTVNCNK